MNQTRLYDAAFLLVLAGAALFTLPYHHGLMLGDDYLGAANQLLHGNWDIEHNLWAHRIGTCLPYTIGMWLFGFGTWLTAITTLEYLLLLIAVYIAVGAYSKPAGFIAVCLLSVSSLLHDNAAKIMSDMAATLTANAVVLCYFYFTFYASKSKSANRNWGILSALLLVFAFLTKESVVFYVPLLAWLWWKDRKNMEVKNYWRHAIAATFISGIALLIIYWIKTGDPLIRLHVIENFPNASDCNYSTASFLTLVNRLTWQPFQFLMQDSIFGILLLLSVLQVIQADKNNAQEKFFKVYFIATIAVWWFGSGSFSKYNPVPLILRYWLPLMAPMAVNSAFFILHVIRKEIRHKTKTTAITIAFLLSAYAALLLSYKAYTLLGMSGSFLVVNGLDYTIGASVILIAIYSDRILKILPPVRMVFFCVIMAMPFFRSCARLKDYMRFRAWHKNTNQDVNDTFGREKEMVLYALSLKPHLILTDFSLTQFYYVYTMNMDEKLPFKEYHRFAPDSLQEGDYLLLNPDREFTPHNINETIIFTPGSKHTPPPEFVIHPEQNGFVLIKENESNRLYKYKGN